ncbi:MAG: hypothetical protein ACOCV2_02780 [Persicimonas sp.]
MTEQRPDEEQTHVASQVAAAWAAMDQATRAANLRASIRAQDGAYLDALREMQRVRDFVGSPDSIIGNPTTKHGEIAEQVHVGVRRAKDALNGRAFGAEIDGVCRVGPVDYVVDGVDIQSKYINGITNSLDHVLAHADKYPNFARGEGRYHIARDMYEKLSTLRAGGEIEGLSARKMRTIERKLEELEVVTGRSVDDLLEPGEATYSEVQQGKIHETIEDREEALAERNEELKEEVRGEHGPSLGGFAKATAIGAGVGGAVGLGEALWSKYKDGKNPFGGDFDAEDWSEVGITAGKGGAGGGVAGGSLYLLTNSTDLTAPFAGSMVSGVMGIGSLLQQYHAGALDADQFVEMSHFVAAEAAIVGLASATGQAVIPVPMLGAFIGGLAGKWTAAALEGALGDSEEELIARLEAYESWAVEQLDEECRVVLGELDDHFESLEHFTALAFDEAVNLDLRLQASIELAETVGVSDEKILRSTSDLDAFITE